MSGRQSMFTLDSCFPATYIECLPLLYSNRVVCSASVCGTTYIYIYTLRIPCKANYTVPFVMSNLTFLGLPSSTKMHVYAYLSSLLFLSVIHWLNALHTTPYFQILHEHTCICMLYTHDQWDSLHESLLVVVNHRTMYCDGVYMLYSGVFGILCDPMHGLLNRIRCMGG